MTTSLRRIFGNAGWFLGSKGVAALLSLFYLALATRVLGIERFGHFALVLGIGQAVSGLVTFQTWQLIVRFGFPRLADGDTRKRNRLIVFAAMLDASSAIAGSILATIAIILLAPRFGWSPEVMRDATLFCIAMLLSLRSTPIGILRLHDRFALAAAADTVTPIVRLIGAGIAAIFSPSISGFLAAWACAEVMTAIAFWIAALRHEPLVYQRGDLRRVFDENPGLWRFAWLTNAASSLNLSAKQVTLLLVGGFGGAAASGAYRVATQLAQGLSKFTLALSRSVYPEFVRVSVEGSPRQLRRLIRRMTMITTAGGVCVLLLTALTGKQLLELVAGPAFATAYMPMLLLGAAATLDLGGASFEPALTAQGRPGLALMLRSIAIAAQFTLLLWLLPSLGSVGAGWATLAGSLVAFALAGHAVRKSIRSKRTHCPSSAHMRPTQAGSEIVIKTTPKPMKG